MKPHYLLAVPAIVFFISRASGAGDIEHGRARFEPTAAEAEAPELYRLEKAEYAYEREFLMQASGYKVWALRLPSPVVTPDIANNTVHMEYFEPEGAAPAQGRPAVVVLHILGADFALSRYISARLARQGTAALFLKLPYYGERRPPDSEARFLSADPERTMRSMSQGVRDVRRAAAWLADRPGIDRKRLGVAGVSLGGIVASVAVAVDPALSTGAFLLAGGDLAEIFWNMPEARKYRDLWVESGRTKADLERLTHDFDPLTYAHKLKNKRILMIAGSVDEVIPPASARALWERAGKPEIVWYDCGHYSAVGYLLPGIRKTVDFLSASADR